MIKKIVKSAQELKDLGFGSKVGYQGERFINRDGRYNVLKKGLPFNIRFSFYYTLIHMKWWKFHLWVLFTFIFVNLAFGAMYYWAGIENLIGAVATTPMEAYLEAVFFSAQTLTTVGYGRVNPIGINASLIATLETLIGMMAFALATGLLYGRFSRPSVKIIYSHSALISPYKEGKALMFRLVNARESQLTEMEINVSTSLIVKEEDKFVRKFYQLPVDQNKVNFMSLNWTVVHPINEDSPFFQFQEQDFEKADVEVVILLKGFDDTYSQTIHSLYSYKYHEMIWGAKFRMMFEKSSKGEYTDLSLDKIDDIEKVDLV